MHLNGEEYSRRLEELSDDTLRMIAELNDTKTILKAAEIIMTKDSEDEIVKMLQKLMTKMK